MGSRSLTLGERVDAARAAAGAVGATVSISIDGERIDAASGHRAAGGADPVTVTTPFRLGSIAKVCTATVLGELLSGHGSLDDGVAALLPACLPPRARGATWRQVLQHRSGIDGTYWEGCGDGPDAIHRYAARVAELPTVFDPGDSWGYSNSGYVLAGAAVEDLTGRRYEEAVAECLLEPLGAASTTLWSEQSPPGAATGHHLTREGPRGADAPVGLRALAPTGSSGWSTAADLLTIADRLLADTWTDLDAAATPMPPGGGASATHQSLGWRVHRWGDTVMFGHDGGAAGNGSFLRWIPASRTGIAVLSNTNPSAMLLWADLSAWFFGEIGVTVPPPLPADDAARVEPELCGVYEASDARFTVTLADGTLALDVDGLGGRLRRSASLTPLSPGIYRSDSPITDLTGIVSFEAPRAAYRLLHAGAFTARAAAAET